MEIDKIASSRNTLTMLNIIKFEKNNYKNYVDNCITDIYNISYNYKDYHGMLTPHNPPKSSKADGEIYDYFK